ncbi:MAG: ABC transporter permease [Candidatus Cloacimonetes bacterium]|nr:ABC transporter permease [Candidatus Cloacimonadota bacterium]
MDKLEQFFFLRYIKAPKRNLLRFSFVFMTLGIVLSVAILSAGLNLFEGYERSLKAVLLGSFPHITIQNTAESYISPIEANMLTTKLTRHGEVSSVLPALSYSAMAVGESKVRGISLTAYYSDGSTALPFEKYVSMGNKQLAKGEAIVGKYLAKELGKSIGDTLKVVYPQLDKISALGIFPSQRSYKITGIYSSGLYESDRSSVICTWEDAQALLGISPGFSKLEIRLQPQYVDSAINVSRKIMNRLGSEYYVYPWTTFSSGLLGLIRMEKWLIFIIFCFLVLIAGVNVISAVSTIILDKKNEIAVLKTLGASSASIKKLLSYQVGLVAFGAILLGQILGALLSLFVEKQGFYKLKGDVYFIDTLSAAISPLNQVLIFCVAALLVTVCIRYPLRQIDKLQIMELLRNP